MRTIRAGDYGASALRPKQARAARRALDDASVELRRLNCARLLCLGEGARVGAVEEIMGRRQSE
jgi:hypothetical protein